MRRKVIVTGGAGFIGSHLVERLLAEKHQVVVLDNFSSGRPENLDHLAGEPRLQIEQIDVAERSNLHSHFVGAEWVFHLAALADIVPSVQCPFKYHRANVDGTVNVLEAAREAGVSRLVYAASSSCYGIAKNFPTAETEPARPAYPYALTKYVGEQYVLHWARLYGLPCVSLRLFNVFGPRARTLGAYGAVFGVFLAQKLAGKPFTVVGDGAQSRDFTFVTDVAEAFVRAAESDLSGEVFNVGTGRAHSINYLVELLRGRAVHIPKRPGEPDCTLADTRKIARIIGWQAKVRFEEGVTMMLRSANEWRRAPVWDEKSIAAATQEWFACLGAASDRA